MPTLRPLHRLTIQGRDDGTELKAPYRLSGVLKRESDGWRFVLFNGAEPVASDSASRRASPSEQNHRKRSKTSNRMKSPPAGP